MIKAYKYRIYPTDAQKLKIEQTIDICRLVYNLGLQTKIEAYKANGTHLSAFDLSRQLTEMKKDYPWICEVDSQALQASLKKIDVAFKGFFNGKGYPKFKSKRGKQSFQCRNNTRKINWVNSTLRIPKIKDIPIVLSKRFEGEIKTVTISRSPSGKYFASISVDNGMMLPNKLKIKSPVGLDLGIKDFVVTSDGDKVENPKYLKNNLMRLKCLQRRLSRAKIRSNNRKKAVKKLAIQYEKITNKRNDFLQKLSTSIIKEHDTICVENLNISGMIKNRKLSQSISDVGWGEFVRQLKYKSEWYGNNLIEIGRFEPSSKMCSNCEAINDLLTLKDREWACTNCGSFHDRDINAAINIKNLGLKKHSGEGISGEPVELSTLVGAKKQENVICLSNNIIANNSSPYNN